MNETEEIKSRLPVEQLIGTYLPLKRAGRVYKGLCPFHNEKTPSFTVNPDRGIFKCFGCGEGGDIFEFVMKIEGLTFGEAVKLLAEKAGVALPEWKPEKARADGQPSVSKTRLYEINSYTARLWNTILLQHPKAQGARDYVFSRGLTEETIRNFYIGYAPAGSVTGQSLRNAGFSIEEIKQAGDPTKFQNRIVFPISDLTGKVVAFTGRVLDSTTAQGPKYWNSPETAIFFKSRAVFALHLAKRAIQDSNLAILAEGQMDVVMLHQEGYPHAVASSGTALTSEQLRLIGRFSRNIAFAYDQDKAGIEATKKGISLALQEEITPYVIRIPSGKDPAEALQKDPESWKQAYQQRQPYMKWLLDEAKGNSDPNDPLARKRIVTQLLPWLAQIHDPIEQNEWIRYIASPIRTTEEALREALKRMSTPKPSAAPTEKQATLTTKTTIIHPLSAQAETALALIIAFPDIFPPIRSEVVDSLSLAPETSVLEKVLPLIRQHPADSASLTTFLEDTLGGESFTNLSVALEERLKPYEDTELDQNMALFDILAICKRLRSEQKESLKHALANQIQAAQQSGDTEEVRRLFSELKNLV